MTEEEEYKAVVFGYLKAGQSKHGGRRVQQCGMFPDKTVCYWCDAEVLNANANGKEAIAAFLRVHPHGCEARP